MRILITTDAYDNMINGVAISVKNLTAALLAEGHDVRILTLSTTDDSYQEENVYYLRSIPLKIYPDARIAFPLSHPFLRDIREWKPDIIHSQCEFSTFRLARKLAKQLHIPLVHTYHTLYEYYTHYFCPSETLGRRIVAFASRLICNQADVIVAPTKKTAQILEAYHVNTPLRVIPSGLALERLQVPLAPDFQRSLKLQLQIPENAPVLVTLGRLAREKNIDFLLQQMHRKEAQDLGLHLVIVGDGPDRERLESMVSILNLEKIVHFTGMVPPEQVAQYYHLGDIFVSASQSETQGLTYIEAMACGLPLLCLKDACLEHVLIPRYNGFYFENPDEFLQECKRLLCCSAAYRTMQANALQSVAQFSKETFEKRILYLYEDLIRNTKEEAVCTPFTCIPKQIWHKVTGF